MKLGDLVTPRFYVAPMYKDVSGVHRIQVGCLLKDHLGILIDSTYSKDDRLYYQIFDGSALGWTRDEDIELKKLYDYSQFILSEIFRGHENQSQPT